MERKIGEIFEYNGQWYQCVEVGQQCCSDCAFHKLDSTCHSMKCSLIIRSDETSVIFKKLKKVGEPYERFLASNDSIKVQRYRLPYRYAILPTEPIMILEPNYKNSIEIQIKQTNEDMEEKNNVNTPLNVLTDKYVNGDICYDDFEKEVKALYSCKEEIKPTLKEFDLEAAKLGKPVCTRDGRKARIICFDKQEGLPIVALVETNKNGRISEEIALFDINGRAVSDDIDSKLDLMMLPEKKEGWVNVYHSDNGYNVGGLYSSEEEAIAEGIAYAGLTHEDYGEPMFIIEGCKQTFGSAKDAYAWLIDKISGKGTWQSNPYVFVYDFELVKCRIMSKQCLDVQQMQHLQELGLELDYNTVLSWIVDERGKDKPLLCISSEAVDYVDFSHYCLPAYTLQDVLDALPKYYHIANIGWTKLSIRVHTTKDWEIGYVYTDELSKYAYQCRKTEKNLIDAAYELLVWCVENKFVETNKNE